MPLRSLLSLALCLAICGCACHTPRRIGVYTPPPPVPSFHDLQQGTPIRRVAMLPLYYERGNPNAQCDLDSPFHFELTKTSMFEIVWISRVELEGLIGQRQLSSVDALPSGVLAQISKKYGADAVLFTELTHFFPYLPISMGVRSKLVDIRSGEVRWAFDHLFDSGTPQVACAAQHYYMANRQTNLPVGNDGRAVLQSPSRFAGYAAWETYRSLLAKPVPVCAGPL